VRGRRRRFPGEVKEKLGEIRRGLVEAWKLETFGVDEYGEPLFFPDAP
jgi:hypothetical protein